MSRCVPSWDLEDDLYNSSTRRLKGSSCARSSSMSSDLHAPTLDNYEVAELTWKNGQLGMHCLGPRRVVYKPHTNTTTVTKFAWDKPRAAETLETIVNQATLPPNCKPPNDHHAQELVPWLDHHGSAVGTGASATMTMDALVPSAGIASTQPHALLSGTNGNGTPCSTRVGSCSDGAGFGDHVVGQDGGEVAREWNARHERSVSGSETLGMESGRQLTAETRRGELGVKGLTCSSMGSPEDSVSGKRSMKSTSPDEHDSVCHSRPQIEPEEKKRGKGKLSITTKRGRAAAIHNQSERRRREKINEKMKTLQKLVPNANKTDKASMLDEVIEYLKQLQAQIHTMNRMSMSPMMMSLAMRQQQQLQMGMMNPMGMGIGMGMGMGMPMQGVMDFNAISNSSRNIPGMSSVFHPPTFMQPMMASWDMQVPNPNDPMVAFLACQAQPMTMEGYSRMVAMFQQMQNQP